MAGIEQIKPGSGVSVTKNNECRVYVIRSENGEGVMTSYEILNGIYVMYSDIHMVSMDTRLTHNADLFCLDYCYKGRLEWGLKDGSYLYQKAGDLSMDNRNTAMSSYYLPLRHYHAVSIAFFLPAAQESVEKSFPGFPVKIKKLRKKFTSITNPYVIRNCPRVESLYKDICYPDDSNKTTYLTIKILELLLYLDSFSTDKQDHKQEYFYKIHVEKIKLMHEKMINNLEHHYTLNGLSKEFEIPLTAMTNTFKGVYGSTIYAYMRNYRMHHAARILLQSNVSIADVALSVGYVNPSKFSDAFRQEIGKLPSEYRKMQSNQSLLRSR